MRSFTLGLFLALALLTGTSREASAQFAFVPFAGYNLDAEAALVGVGVRLPLPIASLPLTLQPSVEYLFVDGDVTFLQVDGNLLYNIPAGGSIAPYVGAGVGIAFVSVEVLGESTSDTSVGINALGGVEFPGALGFGTPFVQGRATFNDGTAFSIMGGLVIGLN